MLLPTKVELFTTLAAVMLVAPSANVPPTAPVKVTVPVPAVIVNARDEVTLFSVLLNVMLPLPEALLSVTAVFNVVATP